MSKSQNVGGLLTLIIILVWLVILSVAVSYKADNIDRRRQKNGKPHHHHHHHNDDW